MLILVGVTINVVLNGGLINTASTATKDTEKEVIYDQILGAIKLKDNGHVNVKGTYEAVTDILGEDKVTVTNPTVVDENTIEVTFEVTGNKGTYKYKITEGFGVVDTSAGEEELEALIEDITEYETYITEENIENGIVIQDEVGNEFVWIPVDEINDMVMCQSAEEIPEGAPEGTTGRCTLELQGETLKCTKHNSQALAGRLYADMTIKSSKQAR